MDQNEWEYTAEMTCTEASKIIGEQKLGAGDGAPDKPPTEKQMAQLEKHMGDK